MQELPKSQFPLPATTSPAHQRHLLGNSRYKEAVRNYFRMRDHKLDSSALSELDRLIEDFEWEARNPPPEGQPRPALRKLGLMLLEHAREAAKLRKPS